MYVACGSHTGSGFVFHRQEESTTPGSLNFTWVLNSSFQAPSGADGHYGHVTVINENLASFGAFGHGKKYIYTHHLIFSRLFCVHLPFLFLFLQTF